MSGKVFPSKTISYAGKWTSHNRVVRYIVHCCLFRADIERRTAEYSFTASLQPDDVQNEFLFAIRTGSRRWTNRSSLVKYRILSTAAWMPVSFYSCTVNIRSLWVMRNTDDRLASKSVKICHIERRFSDAHPCLRISCLSHCAFCLSASAAVWFLAVALAASLWFLSSSSSHETWR